VAAKPTHLLSCQALFSTPLPGGFVSQTKQTKHWKRYGILRCNLQLIGHSQKVLRYEEAKYSVVRITSCRATLSPDPIEQHCYNPVGATNCTHSTAAALCSHFAQVSLSYFPCAQEITTRPEFRFNTADWLLRTDQSAGLDRAQTRNRHMYFIKHTH
jgi:hypothetical protein